MSALQQAFASNEATPIDTLEFSHSSFGVIYVAKSYFDLTATLEDSSVVVFQRAGLGIQLPERSTDGQQELSIQLDNLDNDIYLKLRGVQEANRATQEQVVCKYRPYLLSDLSAPAGAILKLLVTGATINTRQATIRATWANFPDTTYPRGRYYATDYPGVKYV